MALKALDIFKLLPKTNCKKCGCPTCLAFAMKMAQKQASLDECPDVSDESKALLAGGNSEEDVRKVLGLNVIRIMAENEAKSSR